MKKKTSAIILSAILLGSAAFLFEKPFLLAVGDHLIVQDTPQPVDVIHVIAGDDYRTDYAIQLYKLGYAKHLFFTGGWCSVHGWEHGTHAQQLALQQGVPQEAIAFDDAPVTSTYAEVERLKNWILHRSSPIRSVMVVSDPFHMRRAQWTYRQLLGNETKILMAPVPFDQTPYRQQWWLDQASQTYVREEYIKSIYYVLRYQLAWGGLKDWLAGFDVY